MLCRQSASACSCFENRHEGPLSPTRGEEPKNGLRHSPKQTKLFKIINVKTQYIVGGISLNFVNLLCYRPNFIQSSLVLSRARGIFAIPFSDTVCFCIHVRPLAPDQYTHNSRIVRFLEFSAARFTGMIVGSNDRNRLFNMNIDV